MASKKSRKALLQKLEEYGDSVLDERGNKNSRKQQKTNSNTSQKNRSEYMRNKQKVKKNKVLKTSQHGDIVKPKKSAVNKKMKWLKEALGSDGAVRASQQSDVTDKTHIKRTKKEAEVIVFQDPTRRRPKDVDKGETTQSTGSEFDMNTARFEVRKLGISGFGGEKKSDARVSLLVSLGAKPAKKKSYVNYKEFQKQRKAEIDADRQRREEEQVPGEKRPKKRPKKGPRSKDDMGGIDGQIGHYKNGVQFISKGFLKKMKVL